MKRRLATRVGFVLGVLAGSARACPCSDDSGSAGGLLRGDERYAAALVATSRRALGRFDALGRYSALREGESETSEELLARVALRGPERVEWLGELGYAAFRFHAPGLVEHRVGIGDALLRARYRVVDEGMPQLAWPRPALTLSGLLRAPLGAISRQRSEGFGSGGAQLGLGAWELGGGLEVKRTLVPRWDLLLGIEAAYRFEDHVLGASHARRLGPRAELGLGARFQPSDWLAWSLALRARVVADVTLDGHRLAGTDERAWSLVSGLVMSDRASHLRSSVTLSLEPPLTGLLQVGATAAAALSVALGYGW